MENLTQLGKPTRFPQSPEEAKLESFPNTHPGRDYLIQFTCPEFTAFCPITGQPDFAEIRIEYTPDELCVELKSLKLYLGAFRNVGIFHENITNRILDDLVALLSPRYMQVVGDFTVRGGIKTVVTATHRK
ncbi:NADPH-dependent 7-cyano-7-deazaguanine reductase QueF [bacterium]|nr:NADPH-dependent 7-cyano-7-deazaguanine reductase QueF [bacterium]